jgi:hypothetical protein
MTGKPAAPRRRTTPTATAARLPVNQDKQPVRRPVDFGTPSRSSAGCATRRKSAGINPIIRLICTRPHARCAFARVHRRPRPGNGWTLAASTPSGRALCAPRYSPSPRGPTETSQIVSHRGAPAISQFAIGPSFAAAVSRRLALGAESSIPNETGAQLQLGS